MNDQSDGSFELPGTASASNKRNGRSNNHSNSSLLTGSSNTDPFPGDKYISSRRNSSQKSKKKKEKRRSSSKYLRGNSSSSSLNHSNSNLSNSKSSNMDVVDQYYEQYAKKYVKQPEKEDEALLELVTPSATASINDPLAMAGSYSDDPNATSTETFVDEYDAELLDDVDMEDKYKNFDRFGNSSTAKQSKLRKFTNYAIPCLICALFLMGMVSGILYLAGVGESNDNKNNSQQNPHLLQHVAPAPTTLNLMCDQSTIDVPTLCRQACQAAECCWNPNGLYECTDLTQHQCPPYQEECRKWKNQLSTSSNDLIMTVPNMPKSLKEDCAPTAFEPTEACYNGCALADCCWNPNSSQTCAEGSSDNCADYREVCDVLVKNNADKPFPDPPEQLSAYCDPSQTKDVSLHICQDKCSAAECCWKTGVLSCVSEQECHEYTQSCAILNDLATAPDASHDATTTDNNIAHPDTTEDSLVSAPDDLEEICAHDTITDPGTGGENLITCEKACLKGACCWHPNAKDSCTDNSKCDDYNEPCSIFASLFDKPQGYDPTNPTTLAPQTVVNNVPEASHGLNLLCSPDVLKTSVDNGKFIVECEKECLKGACCWKTNHPTICPDAPECDAYMDPCGKNLMSALLSMEGAGSGSTPSASKPVAAPTPAPTKQVEINVPEAPSDIGIMCSPDVLTMNVENGEFFAQCEKLCLAAACCWKENHPTVCPDAPQCQDYHEPCVEHLVPALEGLENPSNNDADDTTTTTPTSVNIPSAPSDMELRCSMQNLKNNPDGRGFCEESCNKAMCCWKYDDDSSCQDNAKCNQYSSCKNLLTTEPITTNTNAPPRPPADLSAICSTEAIVQLTGLELCHQTCSRADCCWLQDSDSDNCKGSSDCQEYYTACELMRTELNLADESANGDSAIDNACNGGSTSYDRSRCEAVCRPGACCFDDKMACLSSTDCSIYDSCDILNRRNLLRQR